MRLAFSFIFNQAACLLHPTKQYGYILVRYLQVQDWDSIHDRFATTPIKIVKEYGDHAS